MTTKYTRFAVIAMLALFATAAFADPIAVQGSTTGAFYLGSNNQGSSVNGLTFTGASFGPTMSPTITLGTFSLAALFANYNPYDFAMAVNLTVPAGAGGTNVVANVSGGVFFGAGSATIDFGAPVLVTYSNATGSGSFNLSVSDVQVGNLSSKSVVGTISNATFAAAPEPVSIVLLSTLFGGVALFFRKRLA